MSVPKGKRGISDMEFFRLSNDLYDKFEDWLLRDFGVREKVRQEVTEGEPSQPPVILQFPKWFISHKRRRILSILDKYMDALITANTIYPTNYVELHDRRHHQNHAISQLEYLEQFLQRTLKTMPLSKAKTAQYFDLIEHTISIVKLWRKSNNKIRKILDNKVKTDIKSFKASNDISILMPWGLSNAIIENITSEKGGKERKPR